MEDIEQNSEEF